MPFRWVELAAREDVECGTSSNRYVSDDQTGVVSRKGVVYRVWKDIEAVVKEEDKQEYDEREDAKLDGSANLSSHQYAFLI